MGSDFFDRLDADLAALTRAGAHVAAGDRRRGQPGHLLRRGLVLTLAVLALTASLVSEFPASASGHVRVAPSQTALRL